VSAALRSALDSPIPPAPAETGKRRLRIAYLTTQYPAVSHTFIRRELLEIERRAHEVHRLAIRTSASAPVDPVDKEELAKTFHVLSQPNARVAFSSIPAILTRPRGAWAALNHAFRLSSRSERGLPRHIAYFAEACLLLEEVTTRGIEHIHVHFGTNAAAVAMLMRHMGGPPFSMTVHGPAEFDAPIGLSLGDKIAAAEFVCAISDYCGAQLRRWVPLAHWDKIHVVHCTVGDQFFRAAAPIDPASKTLVCIGRLAPAKGHLMLVDAFSQAVKSGVDAKLVFCGDGELRGAIEGLAAAGGLQGRVEITGWIDEAEVRRRLLSARCLVLPSFAEGLPMVIMEAFALGRPVISSMIAGIPELVVPEESGWLVTPGRADQTAAAIRQMMNTPVSRLEEMGQAGRAAVLKRHNTTVEGEKLEKLFLQAAARNASKTNAR
jgi:glycosyltransferase involved in cell wall biosynthesis